MNTEQYIIEKFKVDVSEPQPHFIKMSRWKTMPYVFAELGFKVGAEIGVERGKYADCLLRKIPGLALYCVDPWVETPGYREGMQSKIEQYRKETYLLLKKHKGARIMEKFSVAAAKDIPDGSLDFVFIDGNHDFENVVADIAAWTPKVRQGGIISGHDFCDEVCAHERIDVETAVLGWVKTHDIKTWFIASYREYRKVWLWVKK